MEKNLYIDASHPDETRVVLKSENYIEEYHKQYNLPYTILRYGSLYGPRSDKRNGIYRFIHQAITEIEDNKVEPGTIVQEIQAGYMFGERLLRPSLVSVSKKSEQKIKQNKGKDEKKS